MAEEEGISREALRNHLKPRTQLQPAPLLALHQSELPKAENLPAFQMTQ